MRLKSLYHARSFQLFYFGEPKQQNIPLDFKKKNQQTNNKRLYVCLRCTRTMS